MDNIAEVFTAMAEKKGSATAVIEAATNKRISFESLSEKVEGYADFFAEQGLAPGERVILMLTPSINFIAVTFALFKLGTPIVLIDPGMGYKNLLSCVEGVKASYLIGVPKAVLFSYLFKGKFRELKRRFCCGNTLGLLGRDIAQACQQGENKFLTYAPAKEDLAAIIFTTGSTGPPKGVCYEHGIFHAQLELIQSYYKIGETDIDQPAFPLFALFSAALGACSVLPDMDPTRPAQVDPAKFINSIKAYGVTYSFGSPAIWNVVARYCLKNKLVLHGVKTVLMAGAPVPYGLMQKVKEILPEDCNVYTPYGATESLPIVSIEGDEIIAETWKKTRKGLGVCVGRPLPGIELKIIARVDQKLEDYSLACELGVEEIGEILVKGAVVTKAYYGNEKETRLAKIKDGEGFWHRMGDLGYLDSLGRLWFCGRKAHCVLANDTIYYSIPCEAIVNEHPDVYRSALVGLNESCGKAVPALIVEPFDKEVDEEKLLEEVRALALKNALTEDIEFFLVHHDFPVDIRHNAKIFREKLAVWAQQQIF